MKREVRLNEAHAQHIAGAQETLADLAPESSSLSEILCGCHIVKQMAMDSGPTKRWGVLSGLLNNLLGLIRWRSVCEVRLPSSREKPVSWAAKDVPGFGR